MMTKNTGIIRKVDSLGRVTIPQELRGILDIKKGDSMEIYTQPNGSITLKKYEPSKDSSKKRIAEIVAVSDIEKNERKEIMKLLQNL